MKRNLLTLVLGFSFLFFGVCITNTAAFTGKLPAVTKNSSLKISSSTDRTKFKPEFSKKFAKLKSLCETNFVDPCTAQLTAATIWGDWAFSVCEYSGDVTQHFAMLHRL